MEDCLIIGAGLSGLTIARLLAESGKTVTIIDKRKSIGGNAFDYTDKNGIIVQPYGPHIFHTDSKEVFEFLSQFTEWNKYEHRVLASIYNKYIHVPFNLNSLKEIYKEEKANRIKKVLIEEIGYNKKVPILQLKNNNNSEIKELSEYIYNNIFYTYTKKQWGTKPEELGETVMNRVPVYISEEDRYFTDEFQYMPKEGFTKMCKNIVCHKNIKLILGKDCKEILSIKDDKIYVYDKEYKGIIIYTGCVDELFDYKFGKLPYRSLKFKVSVKNKPSYQPSAVVNYTVNKKYTRITEFSKFTSLPQNKTVIMKEYPVDYNEKKNIPYYPIVKEENISLYEKYSEEAKKYKNLYLLGRLANYKYINMDIAVLNAITLAKRIIEE